MQNIKTVFLDVDDTLWAFTKNSPISLRHVYEVHGISQWCEDYEKFKAIYLVKNHELWDLYHYGKIEQHYLVTERFRYVLEKIGCDVDLNALAAKMNEEYLSYLATLPAIVPGAKELLQYLTAKGYDVNALSNGFKGVQLKKLQSGGIDGYVRKVILSDDCGITKPLRGIFDYALEQCDAESATSVMIGDEYDTDIAGAHNAGWHTIFYNWRKTDAENSVADVTVDSLEEIMKIL